MKRFNLDSNAQRMFKRGYVLADMVCQLKEEVDGKRLLAAVKEALLLHPLFNTKICEENGTCFLLENEKEPVVNEANPDALAKVCCEESNDYPFAITYYKNRIFAKGSHTPFDGGGMMAFFRTVLRKYFELGGAQFFDVEKWDITPGHEDETTTEPQIEFSNPDAGQPMYFNKLRPSQLPLDAFDPKESDNLYYFTLKRADFKEMSIKSETSTFAVFACYLSKATEALMPDEAAADSAKQDTDGLQENQERIISIDVPLDCRGYFGSKTDRRSYYTTALSYKVDKLKGRPDEMAQMAFRSQLDICAQIENVQAYFNELKYKTEHGDVKDHLKDDVKNPAKILLTVLNKSPFPSEMEDMMDGFWLMMHRPEGRYIACASVSCFKDEFTLTVCTDSKDAQFIKELSGQFEKAGFSYKLRKAPIDKPDM